MSNVSDLTLEVLKDIRSELIGVRSDLTAVNQRLDVVTKRLDTLTVRVETGFAEVNSRLDNVIEITGRHHAQLESRVRRIEDHLGLPPG